MYQTVFDSKLLVTDCNFTKIYKICFRSSLGMTILIFKFFLELRALERD